MEKIGNDLRNQLRDSADKFVVFSLALNESTDIGDTAQLLIFLRGVTDDSRIFEELLALVSLKNCTRGCDSFNTVCGIIDENGLRWSSLVALTAEGAISMAEANSGVVALLKERRIK